MNISSPRRHAYRLIIRIPSQLAGDIVTSYKMQTTHDRAWRVMLAVGQQLADSIAGASVALECLS